MFEQTLAVEMDRSHRGWTLLASLAGQTMAVGVAVILPLLFPEVLPQARLAGILVEPPPPPPPPPAAVRIVEAVIERAARTQILAGKLFEPVTVPDRPATIIDEPPPAAAPAQGSGFGVPGGIGVPGGVDGGVLHSVLAGAVARAITPPPPALKETPPAPPAAPVRLRIGGLVQQGKILNEVIPVYPPLARAARIQGTVRLEGIVGKDGRVRELKVVGGHPLLIKAALEAVRQWIYRPTFLNGEPVEVIAPIEVTFTLN